MKHPNSTFTTILFTLGFLALCPIAQAVVPLPDGGYPNFTTAEGQNALKNLTTGAANTAVGWYSLFTDSSGSFNTAVGAGTLVLNTGDNNTATGAGALLFNIDGSDNTAVGAAALLNNTSSFNTAIGSDALLNNTTGGSNIAVGPNALFNNTEGGSNSAIGNAALFINTTGGRNTAIGQNALFGSTGDGNVAVGFGAGSAVTTASGVICIGTDVAGENASQHTYIGNINTTSVSGGGTDTVTVNLTTGLLGHLSSSRRYKEDIKPMDRASEAVYRLKPVSYNYKKEIDSTQSPAFGLIAEEVADVNSALVARNSEGQPESVHYEMVNAMLLNEFLKEHRKVEEQACKIEEQGRKAREQEATIAQMKKGMDALVAHIKEQDSKIQKVTDRVEMSKAAVQRVVNSQ